MPRRSPTTGFSRRAAFSDARADPARRSRDPGQSRRLAGARPVPNPFLTAFTDGDPVTAGQHVRFQEEVPGAAGQPHTTIRGAGHFVQEEAGESSRASRSTSSRALPARERGSVRILPPPDNDYRGSRIAIWFLWFQIAVNVFRGGVHVSGTIRAPRASRASISRTTERRPSACSPRSASTSSRGPRSSSVR